ncbi:MAG: hypothetical protein M5R36_27525 [Deltaproteobacteria bacterium]|nr:hypothetical protein [Deltaproteobacteria bacterium]
MNKHATIYERKGKIFIGTDSLTTAGIWLGDGQITLLQSLDIPYEIGSAVLAALANSRGGVHHPEQHEWSSLLKELMKPLYIAAGVKSWSAFQSDARCITVNLHEGIIIIEPSKKKMAAVMGL